MKYRNLFMSILTLLLGVLVYLIMSPDDPTYLKIAMPFVSVFCVFSGLFGLYTFFRKR